MSIRVLLADDHGVVRDGLRVLLEAQDDITVVGAAADGREAVRLSQKLRPDVVVMDIAMPELNGTEAAYQICATCPSTRIVILSMHSSSEHVYRALQAGAEGYLLKESAGKEVADAVRAVYSGRHYLSGQIADAVVHDYIDQAGAAPPKNPLERLGYREREILQLVVEGKSSAQIAETVYLSYNTVETYRSRLMQKLDIGDLPTLVKFAIQYGLTALEV